jgi:hypothetical protein
MISKIIFTFLAACFLLTSCENRFTAQLEKERDSLQQIIKNRSDLHVIIAVSNLLDSIENVAGIPDAPRDFEPTSLADRVRSLGARLGQAEAKLLALNKSLRASQNETDAYLMLADAFRGEVEIRDSDVEALTDQVTVLTDKSNQMSASLASAELKIGDLFNQHSEKDHQLAELNIVLRSYKNEEAERCYQQGERLKASSKRIWYSAPKRKETIREAVELYKKAYLLGKADAITEIEHLEKKIPANDVRFAPSTSSE